MDASRKSFSDRWLARGQPHLKLPWLLRLPPRGQRNTERAHQPTNGQQQFWHPTVGPPCPFTVHMLLCARSSYEYHLRTIYILLLQGPRHQLHGWECQNCALCQVTLRRIYLSLAIAHLLQLSLPKNSVPTSHPWFSAHKKTLWIVSNFPRINGVTSR